MNICEICGPVAIRFNLKHYLCVVKGSIRFLTVLDQIFFILAGNNDIHKSLNEFKIGQDLTTDYGVNCP